jgi:hypothetical protein
MPWVSPIRAIASNLSGKLSASLPATIGAVAFKAVAIRTARRNGPDFVGELLPGAVGHDCLFRAGPVVCAKKRRPPNCGGLSLPRGNNRVIADTAHNPNKRTQLAH